MISLAIPTYNRSTMTIESFSKVLNNPAIDDIVIMDDYSDVKCYLLLWQMVQNMNNSKIKLLRNNRNLKPFKNKYKAINACKNEWVVLLDSDNIIDNEYINKVLAVHAIPGTIYCPMTLYSENNKIEWDYSNFKQQLITKRNAKEKLRFPSFTTSLNTGNFFVNKAKYLEVHEAINEDTNLSVNDALYFSYLWLLQGNYMWVVDGLSYTHRIHKGSWYKNNAHGCGVATKQIEQLIKSM